MLESAVAWIGANLEVTGVLLAIAIAIGGGIKWVFGLFKKKSDTPTPSQHITVEQPAAPVIIQPQPNTVHLTLEAYEARLQTAREEVLAQIPDASGEQLQLLTNKRDEYESRLRDIEPAYEQAKARIAELEALLEREGNLLGAEELEKAEVALAKGDFDAAEALLIRIEDQGDLEVKRTARAAFGRGKIAEEQVRWLDAADHYAKAARLDPTYETLYKAGTYFWKTGRHPEALRTKQDLLALSEREYGKQAPETATALGELAGSHEDLGQYDKAEPLYRKAIEIDKDTIGERHPHYATGLSNLAGLLKKMGQYDEAEVLYRQAIEIARVTLGETHPDYAVHLNNLAGLLHRLGRREEAELLFRKAIEIGKATLGEAHPDYATRLNNLAELLLSMGRDEEALSPMRQHHEIEMEALGKDHPSTKLGAANYARLLREHFPDDPALAELQATFGEDIGK